MKLKTFKTLMFCSILDFTFLVTDTKIKEQVSFKSWEKKKLLSARFSVKFLMLPARSIELANWFAWVSACKNAITWVSLTSLITGKLKMCLFCRKYQLLEGFINSFQSCFVLGHWMLTLFLEYAVPEWAFFNFSAF